MTLTQHARFQEQHPEKATGSVLCTCCVRYLQAAPFFAKKTAAWSAPATKESNVTIAAKKTKHTQPKQPGDRKHVVWTLNIWFVVSCSANCSAQTPLAVPQAMMLMSTNHFSVFVCVLLCWVFFLEKKNSSTTHKNLHSTGFDMAINHLHHPGAHTTCSWMA